MDNLKKMIYSRIGEGDVEGAIDLFMELLQQQNNTKAYKEALFLKSNLHSAKQQYEIKGVIARQEYELIVNKTLLGLESMLDELGVDTEKKKEWITNEEAAAPIEKKRLRGGTIVMALAFVILLVVIVLVYVQNQSTMAPTEDNPLPEIVERWENGNYQHLFEDLELLQELGGPVQQHLASTRLKWLSSVGQVPFFFIDDFENNPLNESWSYVTGEPGPGANAIIPTAEGGVLELNGHRHASPVAYFPQEGIKEVRARIRFAGEEPAALHINFCMGLPPPYSRTTVGLYEESSLINIWEADANQDNYLEKGFTFQKGQWYLFRAVIRDGEAEIFLNETPIFTFKSSRGHIPLNEFNFESNPGPVQLDNILIFGH